MPDLNLDQELLKASANYRAGDWAEAGASGSVDLRLGAALKRGIKLEAGAGIMGQIQAGFHKFGAASMSGQAQATAQLEGQIQAPLDLFDEAGLAVRLQAVAKAAAAIEFAAGLTVQEFLDQARLDVRMLGPGLKLLVILLEEMDAKVGFMGQAAVAAMAYADLIITGRLVPELTHPAGFTIASDAGLGLKAGAGYRVFAEIGLRDTRRLIRRTIDLAVDETIAQANSLLPQPEEQVLLLSLRAPAKMVLRSAFEVGLSQASGSPTYTNSAAGLSQRCVQVVLEEGQRFLLEYLAALGVEYFRLALADMGVDQATWDRAQPQRQDLAHWLQHLPGEPFELTDENIDYWLALVQSAATLALALGGPAAATTPWLRPLAIVWASAQLMLVTVGRVSNAEARVSFLNDMLTAAVQVDAFSGDLPPGAHPPDEIKSYINAAIGHRADQTIDQGALVTFLLDDTILQGLVQMFPQVEPVLQIIAGPSNDSLVAAARVFLGNAKGFVMEGGEISDKRTLEALKAGLLQYMDIRVERELRPFLNRAVEEKPELQTYVDEVLLKTLRFSVEVVFQHVLNWDSRRLGYGDALREVCSSIMMKLLGRSLVVSADVLLAHAQASLRDQFLLAAEHAADADGIVAYLASISPTRVDAEELAFMAEVTSDTLEICADVFGPFPDETRKRLRECLYGILDTLPDPLTNDLLDNLASDLVGLPSARTRDNLLRLVQDLGEQLWTNLVRFFNLVLRRLAEKGIEFVRENLLEPIAAELERWLTEMAGLAREIALRLFELPGIIFELGQQALAEAEAALGEIQSLLEMPKSDEARSRFVADIQALVVAKAEPFLPDVPFAKEGLQYAVELLLNETFVNPILDALTPAADGAQVVLEQARDAVQDLLAIDPGADITQQLADLLVEHVRAGIRAAFGDANPRIKIVIDHYIDPLSGKPRPLPISITLLDVEIPLSDLVSIGEQILKGLDVFEEAVRWLAGHLRAWILATLDQEQAETEKAQLESQQQAVQAQLADTGRSDFQITILEPLQASEWQGDVGLKILLEGVPPSFLGLGEAEQPRVFVFLNGVPLPLDGFTVEQSGAGRFLDRLGATVPDGGAGLGKGRPVLYQPGDQLELWGTARLEKVPVRSQAVAAEGQKGLLPEALGAVNLALHARSAAAGTRRGGSPWEKGGYDLAAQKLRRGAGVSSAFGWPSRDRSEAGLPARARRDTQAWGDLPVEGTARFGASLTPGEMEGLLDTALPGLVLRRRLAANSLLEGVNTLVVSIVTGRRIKRDPVETSHAVAFLVLPPEDNKEAAPGAKPYDHLPPPLDRLFGSDLSGARKEVPGWGGSSGSPQKSPWPGGWLPPGERKRLGQAGREAILPGIESATALVQLVSKSVTQGALRPHLSRGAGRASQKKSAKSRTKG